MTNEFHPGEDLGKFRIIEEIGRGGMGIVYKAEQTSLQRLVAIKKIPKHLSHHPEIITRFKREALSTARLNHPGIVQIYDYVESGHGPFFVMEYLDPQEWDSLRKIIDEKIILPFETSLRLILGAIRALKVAHQAGLIHRDIKPSNIMIGRDGDAKILDFGIAVLTGQTRLTSDGNVQSGTVDYMSPEQGEGLEVDHRCDIYAIGSILYEMLTGSLPYVADNPLTILRLRSDRDPAPITQLNPDIPPEVEAIVQKAMARDREKRYPSAQHMILEIERYFRKQPFMMAPAVRSESTSVADSTPPKPLALEVNWEESRLRVGFGHLDADVRTVSQYEYVSINPKQVEKWCLKVTDIVRRATSSGGGSDALLAELKRVGQQMYDSLLPLGAKKALRESSAIQLVVKLDDRAVTVPWELLYDGEAFLCRRFECGRVVSTFQEVGERLPRTIQGEAKFLILSNLRGDLRAATEECLILKEQLAAAGNVAIQMRNARGSTADIMEMFREADIIHYSGHASYDPEDPSRCGWLVSDGVFGPKQIRQLQGSQTPFPLLIFANACVSALPEKPDADAESRMFSMANAYLLAGVESFIGTFAEVQDAHAAEFALVFYREILGGRTLGRALQKARNYIVQEYGERHLIWASYLLYGNPGRVVFPGESVEESAGGRIEEIGAKESEMPEELLVTRGPAIPRAPARAPAFSAKVSKRVHRLAVPVLAALVLLGAVYYLGKTLSPPRVNLNKLESMGYEAMETGNFQGAQEAFSGLRQRGDRSRGLLGLAAVAFREGKLDEAQRLSNEVIAAAPDMAYARAILGYVSVRREELTRGVEYLRAALAGSLPYAWQQAEAHSFLGEALAAQEKTEGAITEYESALRLEDDVETYRAVAPLYAKAGRDGESLQAWQKVLENSPDDRWAQFQMEELRRERESEQDRRIMEQVHAIMDRLESPEPPVREATADEWTSRTLGVVILPPRQVGTGTLREGEDEYFVFGMIQEFLPIPRLKVVDRKLLQAVLTELRMTQEELTEPDSAVRLGHILSARVVISTTFFHFPGQIRATAELIDVETTEIRGTAKAQSEEGVEALVTALSEALLAEIKTAYPVQGKIVSVSPGDGIQLNVGKEHGVEEGMIMDVFAEDPMDASPLGQLDVVRVQARSSSGMARGKIELTPPLRVREAERP